MFRRFYQLLVLAEPSLAQRPGPRALVWRLRVIPSIAWVIIRARIFLENVWQYQVSLAFVEEIYNDLSKIPIIYEAEVEVQALDIVAIGEVEGSVGAIEGVYLDADLLYLGHLVQTPGEYFGTE